MTPENKILRKSIYSEKLLSLLQQAENIDYWRNLNPNLTISEKPFQRISNFSVAKQEELDEYANQLKEEGYFQTPPMLPSATLQQMLECNG